MMLGWSFMFCRCFTEVRSSLVYRGGLFARGGLVPRARTHLLSVCFIEEIS